MYVLRRDPVLKAGYRGRYSITINFVDSLSPLNRRPETITPRSATSIRRSLEHLAREVAEGPAPRKLLDSIYKNRSHPKRRRRRAGGRVAHRQGEYRDYWPTTLCELSRLHRPRRHPQRRCPDDPH